MTKHLLALALSGLMTTGVSTYAFSQDQSVVQATADYVQYTSKRQVVDQLLQDALVAFKSPARVSDAGFTAKMPSNMEIVTNKLLDAYKLEPYRTDLLISAANAQIYNKNVDNALALFEQALAAAPDDIDVHSYLAVWSRFKGDNARFKQHMNALATLNPGRKADLDKLFATVDRIVNTPLKETAAIPSTGNNAIVTLGYALNPDGSMHEILIQRLETTLALANAHPKALIVVTGGVPQNHKTEGRLMADWLIEKGVSPERIIEDNYATSTVDNALFSGYALARHQISHATIISSASHVRRGQTLFEVASWQSGPHHITFDTVAFPDKPLAELKTASASEMLGIYRDALRTYGMWSYRSYPLEAR